MKLYFDACCLNRPFDELYTGQAHLEAEAIVILLEQCENGNYEMVSGELLNSELSLMPNIVKRNATLKLEQMHHHFVELDSDIVKNAKEFTALTIQPADALHLASAQKAGVDYFLSTDYKLLKKAADLKLSFKVLNPLDLIKQEFAYE